MRGSKNLYPLTVGLFFCFIVWYFKRHTHFCLSYFCFISTLFICFNCVFTPCVFPKLQANRSSFRLYMQFTIFTSLQNIVWAHTHYHKWHTDQYYSSPFHWDAVPQRRLAWDLFGGVMGCGAAEVTGLGFVVIDPRVLSAPILHVITLV